MIRRPMFQGQYRPALPFQPRYAQNQYRPQFMTPQYGSSQFYPRPNRYPSYPNTRPNRSSTQGPPMSKKQQ